MAWYLPDGLSNHVRDWWLNREHNLAETIKDHDPDLVHKTLKKHCSTLYRSIMEEGLRQGEELIVEKLNERIKHADIDSKMENQGLDKTDSIGVRCITSGYEFWSKFKREVKELSNQPEGSGSE